MLRRGGSVADGDGRVTGADATSFFGMSALSRADLKQVSTGPLVSSCSSPGMADTVDEWLMIFPCLGFACEGMGDRGFQAAGVPRIRGVRHSNAGSSPHIH